MIKAALARRLLNKLNENVLINLTLNLHSKIESNNDSNKMRQRDEKSFKEIKADMTDIKQVNFVLPVRIAYLEWKRWQLSDQYSRGKCLEVSRIDTEKCFSK